MKVSAWSIKKPIPTIVLFLILTIVGWFCFNKGGREKRKKREGKEGKGKGGVVDKGE